MVVDGGLAADRLRDTRFGDKPVVVAVATAFQFAKHLLYTFAWVGGGRDRGNSGVLVFPVELGLGPAFSCLGKHHDVVACILVFGFFLLVVVVVVLLARCMLRLLGAVLVISLVCKRSDLKNPLLPIRLLLEDVKQLALLALVAAAMQEV